MEGKAFYRVLLFLHWTKPQAIKHRISLEKQHDFLTGTLTKLVGLRPPVYCAHQDLLEKRAHVLGSSKASISSMAWSAKPGLDNNI